MTAANPDHDPETDKPAQDFFPHTLWSMVRLAIAGGKPGAEQALNELCRIYDGPVLAYIRWWLVKQGKPENKAEDLRQDFFAKLLQHNRLAIADAKRIKFRAFLQTQLKGFLIDRIFRYDQAGVRDERRLDSLDEQRADGSPLIELADRDTPATLFDRQWTEALATHTMQRLSAEYERDGKAAHFALLAPFISDRSDTSIAELATQLGKGHEAVKTDVHRLRKRWKSLISESVAATLDDPSPENIAAELKELMGYRRN